MGEKLERIQLLVFRHQHDKATSEANRRGVSISQVYREWIDAGLQSEKRKR